MALLSFLGILTNAFVVAFLTDFVPQLNYYFYTNFSLEGYVNSTKSFFSADHVRNNLTAVTNPDNESFPYCM